MSGHTHGNAAPATGDAGRKPGTIYTCPMHPQIRQLGPGACTICGMALEPLRATGEAGANPELADMRRRFWIGLALTVPVVALEMGGHVPALGLHGMIAPRLSAWIQFVLATPVALWAGWPFFARGYASLVNFGIWVVFPDPVSPHRMTTWCRDRSASISVRTAWMGRVPS